MPTDSQALKNKIKAKDKEIAELKELLAAAETEVKELNDFTGFEKPKKSVLESRWLNNGIKAVLFIVISAVIIGAGIYPWLNEDRFFGGGEDVNETENDLPAADEADPFAEQIPPADEADPVPAETAESDPAAEPEPTETAEPANMVEVVSDLGWLNVRDEPSVETGEVITQIDSGDRYEWTQTTDNGWYHIILDDAGNVGYVSGEYVQEVE